MNKLDKELHSLKLINLSLSVIILIVILFIGGGAFLFLRPIQIEEYCNTKAGRITEGKSNEMVTQTAEEIKKNSNIMGNGDKITLYYREFLKCRSEQKFFYIF